MMSLPDLSKFSFQTAFSYTLSASGILGIGSIGPITDTTQIQSPSLNLSKWNIVFSGRFWIPSKVSFTGTVASGSPTVTSVSSVVGLAIGQLVTGTAIPANTYITAVGSTTITISNNATGNYSAETIVAQTVPAQSDGTPPTIALTSGGTLSISQPYFYKITATGPQGYVTLTGPQATVETMPSVEVTVTPSSGQQSATLTWAPVSGATGYNIYRGTTTGSENLLVGQITTGTTTAFTDIGYSGASQSPPVSPPASFVEFDISSFSDALGISQAGAHALILQVIVVGPNSITTFAPGSSSGLDWFMTTSGLTWSGTASFSFALDGAQTGQAIGGSTKTFRITNTGSGPLYAVVDTLESIS